MFPANFVWTVPATGGAIVKGGYGHSSVYDPNTRLIYVHGGYHSASVSSYHLSDSLYSYSPHTRSWYAVVALIIVGQPFLLTSDMYLRRNMSIFGVITIKISPPFCN